MLEEVARVANLERQSPEVQLALLLAVLPVYHLTLPPPPFALDSPHFWPAPASLQIPKFKARLC